MSGLVLDPAENEQALRIARTVAAFFGALSVGWVLWRAAKKAAIL